ncbi:hypothetical protein BXP70_13630 [Hymenobacter crusticola]|uniref:DUF6311 domain-containing protein n=2 Tax=Hymenobacter crusticola TaxID=1770526 RepID=A0A243WCR1_9BACT|nr:hypothetical protein BXP70_13630 [Hymenobacter crusticola]
MPFRQNKAFWLVTIAMLLQVGLVLRAFGPLLLHPGQYMLSAAYDGAKNAFTFQAYLQQPFARGLWWFGDMNYPFGDYIFYTDNTPILAVFLKLFSHHIHDISAYALDIYHCILIGGIFLSTALLCVLLRRILHSAVLVVVFSVMLPWLNPQTERLLIGHFNLSFSWVLLLAIWGLWQLYEREHEGRPIAGVVAVVTTGLTVAAFIHLYYLPIVGLCIGAFFVLWLASQKIWYRWRLLVAGAVLTLVPLLISFTVVRLIDGYYTLRRADMGFYEVPSLMFQFSALFKPYSYEKTHFIIEPVQPVAYESYGYLGAFALMSLVVALVVACFKRKAWLTVWQAWKQTVVFRFVLLLSIAGFLGVLAAVGTNYQIVPGQFVVYNYLSVFFYLSKITHMVAHFRAFARFNWPFFWAVNLGVLAGLDYWLRTSQQRWRWLLAVGLVVLAYIDTRDTLKHYRKSLVPNILTSAKNQPIVSELIAKLDPTVYQAILPIPYFHVGSEAPGLVIEDDDRQAIQAFQLSLRTHLPLLASKMSRTPPAQVRALLSMFRANRVAPALRAKLSRKPILVMVDQGFYNGSKRWVTTQQDPAAQGIFKAGARFIREKHLKLLAQAGTLQLYRWDLD